MARFTPFILLALVIAPVGAAQPPTGGLTTADVEEAQQQSLRERLLARHPRVAPPPSRDPRVEAAVARLREAGLDRLDGPDWLPPSGRGHRYGDDLRERPQLLTLDSDRHLVFENAVSLDDDPGYAWAARYAHALSRGRAGQDRKTPVALWVAPGLPAEVVWALAWFLQGEASEVQLIVSRGRVRPEMNAPPQLRERFDRCRRELATGADPICLEELTEFAMEGCPVAAAYRFTRHPYDWVLDPSLLYDECGPQPLVDPQRFEAVWRFWLDHRAPIDTEYLILDPAQPPPRSARTVQQWVRHLMREQLD